MSEAHDQLERHVPMEAVGGYIECSCGWPSKAQYEAGEHFAVHVIAALGVEDDLRSRLACVVEATYWDRPYGERIAAIRGMCDLTTNGMTPGANPEDDEGVDVESSQARAYQLARRRLRLLFTQLDGRRQDWAESTRPCSGARAVAYQSAMQSVHSIIDEIEAIAGGER